MSGMDYGPDRAFLRARAAATTLAAERSPFGHPLPEAEVRAAQAGVDATLTVLRESGLLAPAPLREVQAEAWAECSQWHAEQGMPVNGAGDEHNPYRAEGDGRADR